jgi:hypothetical protein
MDNYYHSPYNYEFSSAQYTPAYNHNLNLTPADYIHPGSAEAQLGLTPMELTPILEHQHEFLWNELAQPPPVLTRPATASYHHKELWVMPCAYIHLESPAGQLGLTPNELKPTLHKQWEFLRDELTQPPPVLTRPTTTYHCMAWVKPQPPAPCPLKPTAGSHPIRDTVTQKLFQCLTSSICGWNSEPV